MNRRDAIRNILLASASTIFITSCSEANVVELLGEKGLQLDSNHEDYLRKISNSFLPTADIQDKVGSPVEFIMRMINDCHSPEEVSTFAKGFQQYKMLMEQSQVKIKAASEEQILPIVEKVMEETEQPQEAMMFFINKVRGLSIQHLMSSEYYMTQHMDYSLVPKETFDGCAEV